MLEINSELVNELKMCLTMINMLSEYNADFKISLSTLSPRLCDLGIEEWGNEVMSEIFCQTITVSDTVIVDDGEEVISIMLDKDPSVYAHFKEIADSYMYEHKQNYELEDDEVDEDEICTQFFASLELGVLRFKSSLFSKDTFKGNNYELIVPIFVCNKYELSENFLLATEIDDEHYFTIWYVMTGGDEFLSYHSSYVERQDIYDALYDMVKQKSSVSAAQKEVVYV